MSKIDKRDRAIQFRQRLREAMEAKSISQSALARAINVDRSTVSQLLSGSGARMPNAQIVGECATELGVSADWLLGLSERPESAADVMAINFSLTEAPRALVDEQIFEWHRQSQGYKIRHVPAALPDMLKTHDMLEWEYRPHLERTTQQAVEASDDRMRFMRSGRSDFEIAMPKHELECFAQATGYYSGLSAKIRRDQLAQFEALYKQLYPNLRLHLFDSRRVYSAPITIFGPLLAVIYVGHHYIAFRDTERVQTLTRHFDGLVREAVIADRDIPSYLSELQRNVGG